MRGAAAAERAPGGAALLGSASLQRTVRRSRGKHGGSGLVEPNAAAGKRAEADEAHDKWWTPAAAAETSERGGQSGATLSRRHPPESYTSRSKLWSP